MMSTIAFTVAVPTECEHRAQLTCGNPPRVICKLCGELVAWEVPPDDHARACVRMEAERHERMREQRSMR